MINDPAITRNYTKINRLFRGSLNLTFKTKTFHVILSDN